MSVSVRACLAGALVSVLGVLGLIRGTVSEEPLAPEAGISVENAYVRQPANPAVIAAYFTINNATDSDVHLVRVTSGAGAVTSLHTGTSMSAAESMTVPARGSLRLAPSVAHVMIERPYGSLLPGQTVNLQLEFSDADPIVVTAPVISITAPAPTEGGN